MYSRYPNRPSRLPENYGGTAFGTKVPEESAPASPRALEIAHPTPPAKETAPPPRRLPPEEIGSFPSAVRDPARQEETSAACPESAIRPLPGLPVGTDEVLILGMILLLSQKEQDSDVIPLLSLLLFCK